MENEKSVPKVLRELAQWHKEYRKWYERYATAQGDEGGNPSDPPPPPPGGGINDDDD